MICDVMGGTVGQVHYVNHSVVYETDLHDCGSLEKILHFVK